MKKKIKLTSGILAGTLLLTNFNVFEQEVAKATEAHSLLLHTENKNILTSIVEENGEQFLIVQATEPVENISVSVKVSNNQIFVFKHKDLGIGESVKFKLDLELPKQDNKRALPKTEVVRQYLQLEGNVKGLELSATISYDIVQNTLPTAIDSAKEETKEVEKEKEVTNEVVNNEVASEETSNADVTTNGENSTESVVANVESIAEPVANNDTSVTPANSEAEDKAETQVEPVAAAPAEVAPASVVEPAPAEVAPTPVAAPAVTEIRSVRRARSVDFTPTTPVVNGNYNEVVANELFNQLNAYRAEKGLAPLTVNYSLVSGAQVRAQEFATKVVNSIGGDLHSRLDNSSWYTAFNGLGYVKAENLVYNNSATEMMNWWKGSAPHNAAMLNPEHKSVTIQVVEVNGTYYGVQIFS